jgi:hypothetical protein
MKEFPKEIRGMNNHHRRRHFSAADDDLIRSQSESGFSIRRLEGVLRTSREALYRRAEELGVTLRECEGAHPQDEPIDTRTMGPDMRDPLLERLRTVYRDRGGGT